MTLRELGHFVGLGDATPPSTDGAQRPNTPITMRAVANNLTPVLVDAEKRSLRAMILSLSRLPAITLDAQIVGDWIGEEPFQPTLRVQPSGGAVLSTGVAISRGLPASEGGAEGPPIFYQDVPSLAQDIKTTETVAGPDGRTYQQSAEFGAGGYFVSVKRTGVQKTGLAVLERDLFFRVNPRPAPTPPSPPTPGPSHPVPPTTNTKYSKVTILNCHADHRTLDIRARDLTIGQEYTPIETLGAQYDENGFCPASGASPVEITIAHDHEYEIVALDADLAGCILNAGDPVDPLNANCWREHIAVIGDRNGPVLPIIVA